MLFLQGAVATDSIATLSLQGVTAAGYCTTLSLQGFVAADNIAALCAVSNDNVIIMSLHLQGVTAADNGALPVLYYARY